MPMASVYGEVATENKQNWRLNFIKGLAGLVGGYKLDYFSGEKGDRAPGDETFAR